MCKKENDQRANSLQIGLLGVDDAAKVRKVLDIATDDINLPEFSADEKGLIANCMARSIFKEVFIQHLDYEIQDYFKHTPDNYVSLDKIALLKEKKNLISKVRNLDLKQRIKLINMVYQEFFKTR